VNEAGAHKFREPRRVRKKRAHGAGGTRRLFEALYVGIKP